MRRDRLSKLNDTVSARITETIVIKDLMSAGDHTFRRGCQRLSDFEPHDFGTGGCPALGGLEDFHDSKRGYVRTY